MSITPLPYYYQTHVRETILSGQDVLLQAPTGAGKTRAAISPGVVGLERGSNYPAKVIYCVPMRVLATNFLKEWRAQATVRGWKHEWYPTIQTGEETNDAQFEGAVIFTTVDQMLASYLNIPYGLPQKLDNINQGAFIGSYIILDEGHLFPRNEMLLSVFALWRMLKGISRFIFMSATFSAPFMDAIGRLLGASIIADSPGTPVGNGIFHDITALTTRSRTVFTEDGALDAAAIRKLRGQRTLCICNTIERAQALYHKLCDDTDIECHLLHSRFLRSDRQRKEHFVSETFEKRTSGRPVVLIATQVIEVGVDVSSDVLLSECAPAASLIQRMGRCARRENEHGSIHIFQPFDSEGGVNYAPYTKVEGDDKESICKKTWDALNSDQFQGKILTFAEEQQLIGMAHGDTDREFLSDLNNMIDRRIDEMTSCMRTRDGGNRSKLIRENDSVPLYIDSYPQQSTTLTEHPYRREAFSVTKRLLAHFMSESIETDIPFILMGGKEQDDPDAETSTTRALTSWIPLREASEIFGYHRFAAHAQAVTYSPELGLRFQPNLQAPFIRLGADKSTVWERIVYRAERYHEHIHGLYHAYTKPITIVSKQRNEERHYRPLREEIVYSLRALCSATGSDVERAERLLRLTLALHDVGKLNQTWQRWSVEWQRARTVDGYVSELTPNDVPFAHTDFDSGNDGERALQKQFNLSIRRGTHAVESAEACLELIATEADSDPFWCAVVLTAIMHHHTPDADQCGSFTICKDGREAIQRSLIVCGFDADAQSLASAVTVNFERNSDDLAGLISIILPTAQSYRATQMYALFVRTLRLADQRSGYYWQQYREQG